MKPPALTGTPPHAAGVHAPSATQVAKSPRFEVDLKQAQLPGPQSPVGKIESAPAQETVPSTRPPRKAGEGVRSATTLSDARTRGEQHTFHTDERGLDPHVPSENRATPCGFGMAAVPLWPGPAVVVAPHVHSGAATMTGVREPSPAAPASREILTEKTRVEDGPEDPPGAPWIAHGDPQPAEAAPPVEGKSPFPEKLEAPRILETPDQARIHMHNQLATLHLPGNGDGGLDIRLRLSGGNLTLDVRGGQANAVKAAAAQLGAALAAQGIRLAGLELRLEDRGTVDRQEDIPEDSPGAAQNVRSNKSKAPRSMRA